MKKLFCLCAVLLLAGLTCVVSAQRATLIDVVYLKNGSVIRGNIVEQVPGESIKIETAEGNLFVYRLDEVSKMTREEGYGSPRRLTASRSGASKRTVYRPDAYWGYKGIVDAGYAVGVGAGMDGEGVAAFSIINGYQCGNFFYAGLGVGIDYTIKGEELMMPVFAHFRSRVLDTKVSPYGAFSLGYHIGLSNTDGGLYYEPTVGVSVRLQGRSSLSFGVGYMGFRMTGGRNAFSRGALSLRLGFAF